MRPVSSLSMAEHNIPSSSALPELMPVAAGPFDDLTQIGPHRSRLPLVLYLLSFGRSQATGCPSWRTTRSHPYTLYAIGTVAALLAGLTHSAWGLVYGYWTRGMTGGLTEDQLLDRGKQAGWIMAIIGLWSLVLTCVYMMCCEYRLLRQTKGKRLTCLLLQVSIASARLSERLRYAYVASVISQDATFSESVGSGEVSTRATKDIALVSTAFGERLGYLLWSLSTVIAVRISCSIRHLAIPDA